MALAHLFPRCPVLPVDASLSLARYLDSVEQTRAAAAECERPGPDADLERAALLHLRVVQLVAKTLPSHPDRMLPASAPTLARLNAAGHDSLNAVERISHALSTASSVSSVPPAPRTTAVRVVSDLVQMPAPILDVFANMLRDRVKKGMRAMGVLAGRTENGKCTRVCALVVPPQAENGNQVVLEEQVLALAVHKGLVLIGVLVHAGKTRRAHVMEEERAFAGRMTGGAGVAVVVAPEAEERVVTFAIVEAEAQQAENIEFVGDELAFKLYDLRPLAKTKEEKNAGAASGEDGSAS